MENKSVYIHIPFCKNICSYCAFCKMYYNLKFVSSYLDTLYDEIKKSYKGEKLNTLYIGGGSPSSLSIDDLKKLKKIIDLFSFENDYEFSFECNLNDLDEEKMLMIKDLGVNRISIGIESFNKEKLKYLNREASFDDAKNKIDYFKKIGILNINVDLIYALKFENSKMLLQDLELLDSLDVSHISTYSLMIEENTVLYNMNEKEISDTKDSEFYNLICSFLEEKGYIHYEVSNFCKKGFESRHNLVYWNNDHYYGFGLSASGYIDNIRYENTKNLNEYLNKKYVKNKEYLDIKEKMIYECILGLRKTEGINIENFKKKFHKDIRDVFDIKKLLDDKDLIIENGYLFVNPSKLYVENEILVNFV